MGRVVGSHSIKDDPGWYLIWDTIQANSSTPPTAATADIRGSPTGHDMGTVEWAATMTIPACLLLKHTPSFHISMPLLMHFPWKAPSLILPTEIIFIHHSLG